MIFVVLGHRNKDKQSKEILRLPKIPMSKLREKTIGPNHLSCFNDMLVDVVPLAVAFCSYWQVWTHVPLMSFCWRRGFIKHDIFRHVSGFEDLFSTKPGSKSTQAIFHYMFVSVRMTPQSGSRDLLSNCILFFRDTSRLDVSPSAQDSKSSWSYNVNFRWNDLSTWAPPVHINTESEVDQ